MIDDTKRFLDHLMAYGLVHVKVKPHGDYHGIIEPR
jgi:hypothetical protein